MGRSRRVVVEVRWEEMGVDKELVHIEDVKLLQDLLMVFHPLTLKGIKIHKPHVTYREEDGELDFRWDLETIKLDLGFRGNGMYSYYALLADGQEFFGDDIDVSQELPLEILKAIAD